MYAYLVLCHKCNFEDKIWKSTVFLAINHIVIFVFIWEIYIK
jgi:hypothetical protein